MIKVLVETPIGEIGGATYSEKEWEHRCTFLAAALLVQLEAHEAISITIKREYGQE